MKIQKNMQIFKIFPWLLVNLFMYYFLLATIFSKYFLLKIIFRKKLFYILLEPMKKTLKFLHSARTHNGGSKIPENAFLKNEPLTAYRIKNYLWNLNISWDHIKYYEKSQNQGLKMFLLSQQISTILRRFADSAKIF